MAPLVVAERVVLAAEPPPMLEAVPGTVPPLALLLAGVAPGKPGADDGSMKWLASGWKKGWSCQAGSGRVKLFRFKREQ